MRLKLAILTVALSVTPAIETVSAASLQVSPVSLEVPAPGAATTITLNNPGATPLKAQMRVYRWSLVDGKEHLEPATEVVASPPMASLQPKTDYVVRVVRTAKTAITGEETYRLVIDEIPERSNTPGVAVAMAFRYSVPVFFTSTIAGAPNLTWATHVVNGKRFVTATNNGGRRVRLADLSITDGAGKPVFAAKGLAGYVLARSRMSWVAPGALQNAAQPLLITAQGDVGPINAQALPEQSR
jgi:fimbrial chaperone protein